jgi:hypothetical protein
MHDPLVEPLTVESVVPCLEGGGFRESGPRKMVLEENVLPGKAVVSENVIPMTTVRWPLSSNLMRMAPLFADPPGVGLEVTLYLPAKSAFSGGIECSGVRSVAPEQAVVVKNVDPVTVTLWHDDR